MKNRLELVSEVKTVLPKYRAFVEELLKESADIGDGLDAFVKEVKEESDVLLERFKMLHGVEDFLGEVHSPRFLF